MLLPILVSDLFKNKTVRNALVISLRPVKSMSLEGSCGGLLASGLDGPWHIELCITEPLPGPVVFLLGYTLDLPGTPPDIHISLVCCATEVSRAPCGLRGIKQLPILPKGLGSVPGSGNGSCPDDSNVQPVWGSLLRCSLVVFDS